MTPYEGFSIVLAAIAILVSIAAIVVSIVTFSKANALNLGNIELYINERITHTKERVSDIELQMSELVSKSKRTAQEERVLETFRHSFMAAVENNINAYEEACAKYLDKKVDRKRFTKLYKTEIRQLVENEAFKEYFDGVTSRYKAVLKVYKSWENLEK